MAHTHLPKRRVRQEDGKYLLIVGEIVYGDAAAGTICHLPFTHATPNGYCDHDGGRVCLAPLMAPLMECDGTGVLRR